MVVRTAPLELPVAGFSIAAKASFNFRRPFVLCAAGRRRSSTATVNAISDAECIVGDARVQPDDAPPPSPPPKRDGGGPEWKAVNSKELGIRKSMISKPTKWVLNGLRKKGYDVYLVGGCVRDLILKRIPKDFDILTTANLHEVKKTFTKCEIIGRRFPICHVYVDDTIVEVSSFNSVRQKENRHLLYLSSKPDCGTHDYIRWRNCLRRDFTINGLMFDPFSSLVYDYLGGIEDIKRAKVRTVIPAHASFQEDCARILRGIRIAARLGFKFSRETAYSVKDLGSSILRLDKVRILMEMNYMLAYGSAESSLRLLWKFGLLELLLPIQAAYFVSQGFRRRDIRSNMMLALFANLDRILAPNRPCHNSLWVGILAFHQALVRQPRDPLVIATFTLAIHNGGNLSEAVDIAKKITHSHDCSFTELLQPRVWDVDDELVAEVLDLSSSVRAALSSMTNEHCVSQAMARYPQAPYSDLVFIPLQLYLRVNRIFECIENSEKEQGFVAKKGSKINYYHLINGALPEVRHIFARVVFDTVYPPNLESKDNSDQA